MLARFRMASKVIFYLKYYCQVQYLKNHYHIHYFKVFQVMLNVNDCKASLCILYHHQHH